MRVTTVRTADGEVVITPNGQITQVTNLSRDWARAVVDVPVPAAVDVNRVSDLLRLIGDEAYKEPDLRKLLLDPPAVMGVQSIDVDQLPGPPGRQDAARQAVRRRGGPCEPGSRPGSCARASTCRPALARRSYDRDHLMRRVRISTWLLTAVFLGTLVIYVLVKLPSTPAAGATPAAPATVQPTSSPSRPAPRQRQGPGPRQARRG